MRVFSMLFDTYCFDKLYPDPVRARDETNASRLLKLLKSHRTQQVLVVLHYSGLLTKVSATTNK